MNRKRNLWIFISIVVLAAALISGFVLMQTSAEEILVQTIESTKTITDGHAIVSINVDTIERDASGTIEVWASRGKEVDGEHSSGSFRVEVLDASEEKAQGAIIVSDGETLWAFSPSKNKVFVGTPEEARAMMVENEFMTSEFGDFRESNEGYHEEEGDHENGDHDGAHTKHPESPEEAVEKLLEYFNVSKSGSETIAGETADHLELEPIPEQMPEEYIAVGGLIDLWIGQESNLPLAVSYTGGSMGEFSATIQEFNLVDELDETLFTFEVPTGAEVVTFADLEPQSLTLEEAGETAEFELLTLPENPQGATLVDILEVRGAIVQRYTLPAGGSFSIAQGVLNKDTDGVQTPSTEGQQVEIRNTTGVIYVSEDGTKVLLTWTEGDLSFSVAGDLNPETALSIAELLK